MKKYKVTFTPDAEKDINGIYEYIALEKGMPDVAWAYIQRLETACYNLEIAALRGRRRDDLRKNLRIVPIDKNAIAAFDVDEVAQVVTILKIFYGGQDYDTIMHDI